jgi:hypothetical protein
MICGPKGAAARLGLNHTPLINKMCKMGFLGLIPKAEDPEEASTGVSSLILS